MSWSSWVFFKWSCWIELTFSISPPPPPPLFPSLTTCTLCLVPTLPPFTSLSVFSSTIASFFCLLLPLSSHITLSLFLSANFFLSPLLFWHLLPLSPVSLGSPLPSSQVTLGWRETGDEVMASGDGVLCSSHDSELAEVDPSVGGWRISRD